MVKRSHVLDAAQGEAEVPYEATRLARKAPGARKRLVGVLLVGALVAVIEAAMTRSVLVLLVLAWLVGAAWGVRKERLGGLVAAALAGVVAALVPLGVWATMGLSRAEILPALVVVALGLATLPDVVTLARDAELQHAYGRWARRQGES